MCDASPPLTLRRRTTYICRSVRSLKSRTTYIYVATSVMNFGAILFTPYMHGAVFCVAVDSWRSGLHSVATVVPPLAPSSPPKSPSFIRQNIPTTHFVQQARTVPDKARLVYVSKRVERGLNINIGLWNKQELLTRKFSVAYCNAYSQTKVIHKNRRFPQKLMFTHTVVPIVVL